MCNKGVHTAKYSLASMVPSFVRVGSSSHFLGDGPYKLILCTKNSREGILPGGWAEGSPDSTVTITLKLQTAVNTPQPVEKSSKPRCGSQAWLAAASLGPAGPQDPV
eukprot:scaffold78105_cov31-Prasinocladus_malaysianus.AAC.1